MPEKSMFGGFKCCLNKSEELRKTERANCVLFSSHVKKGELNIRNIFKITQTETEEIIQMFLNGRFWLMPNYVHEQNMCL